MNPQELPNDILGLSGYGLLWYEVALMAGALLLLAVLAFFIYRFFNRKKTSDAKPARVVSPFEFWQTRLTDLKAEDPFERTQQVEFYFQLSLAVRSCIEEATGMPATDLTYKELSQAIKNQGVSLPVDSQEVLSFLNSADYVKFAERDKSREQGESDKQKAMDWLGTLKAFHERKDLQEVSR